MIAGLVTSLALRSSLSPRVIRAGMVALMIALAIGAAILAWNLWLSDHDDDLIEGHEANVSAVVVAAELKGERRANAADAVTAARDKAQATQLGEAITNAIDAKPVEARRSSGPATNAALDELRRRKGEVRPPATRAHR